MFSLSKIATGIYHLQFDSQVELNAHFLRFQEFYESPEFCGKQFQLIDYVKWYCSTQAHGHFSYFKDWAGFNFPIENIFNCYKLITDKNDHDELMLSIAKLVVKDNKGSKAYLIGSTGTNQVTLEHEIAHALYYLDEEYKEKMSSIVAELPKEIYDNLHDWLINIGYTEHVVVDEIQAFISTGLKDPDSVPDDIKRKFIYWFHTFKNKLIK
jgi:hypothetical protein